MIYEELPYTTLEIEEICGILSSYPEVQVHAIYVPASMRPEPSHQYLLIGGSPELIDTIKGAENDTSKS